MKNNTNYFSHDCNARGDIRMLNIQAEMGLEGYGLWRYFVEIVYEQSKQLVDIEKMTPVLAYLTRIDIEKIEKFFNICINEGLLKKTEEGLYYNERILENMRKREEIAERRSVAGSRGGRMKEAKSKGTHNNKSREEMELFFGCCVRCGDKEYIEKDHIVPVYKGGSDAIDNLQPLCKRCNTAKGQDDTDYREIWCEANGKQMLDTWLSKSTKEKKSKVKESKVNNIKEDIIKEETNITTEVVPVPKKKSIINRNNKPGAIEIYNKIKELCTVVDGSLDDCVVLRSKLEKYGPDPTKLLEVLITKMRETGISKFYSVSSPGKLSDNLGTIVEKLKAEAEQSKTKRRSF